MRKIIILVVIAGMIGVFAVFLLFSGPGTSPSESSENIAPATNEVTRAESSTFSGKGSISSLQNRGGAIECAVVYNPGDMSGVVTGTLFTNSGKVRADFLQSSPDLGEYVSSIVVLPEIVYSWSEIQGETYGVKMDSEVLTDTSSALNPNLPVSFRNEVAYTCDTWGSVDNSVFAPPSDTLFQDFKQVQNSDMEYGTIYEEGEF